VTGVTYASANDKWASTASLLVSSPKTKLCQFISVQLRRSVISVCARLYSSFPRHVCDVGPTRCITNENKDNISL